MESRFGEVTPPGMPRPSAVTRVQGPPLADRAPEIPVATAWLYGTGVPTVALTPLEFDPIISTKIAITTTATTATAATAIHTFRRVLGGLGPAGAGGGEEGTAEPSGAAPLATGLVAPYSWIGSSFGGARAMSALQGTDSLACRTRSVGPRAERPAAAAAPGSRWGFVTPVRRGHEELPRRRGTEQGRC